MVCIQFYFQFTVNSIDTIHLGSSFKLFDEMTLYEIPDKHNDGYDLDEKNGKPITDQSFPTEHPVEVKKS